MDKSLKLTLEQYIVMRYLFSYGTSTLKSIKDGGLGHATEINVARVHATEINVARVLTGLKRQKLVKDSLAGNGSYLTDSGREMCRDYRINLGIYDL